MVKINLKEQSKFFEHQYKLWIEKPDNDIRETNYIEIEKALKDFLFIKSELANYSYLYASQFLFEEHLNLPYWDYLFIKGEIDEELKNELEENALLTIYLFYLSILEEAGFCYIFKDNLYQEIERLLLKYTPNSIAKKKLSDSIHLIKDNYANKKIRHNWIGDLTEKEKAILNEINDNDKWIHKELVQNYFINKTKSFDEIKKDTKTF
jgi:hypothetical protein